MPYIIDNITADTINVKDTLTIRGESIENFISNEGYEKLPSETILTRIPNNYIGWKNKNNNPIYQGVEISSTTEEDTVNGIGLGQILFANGIFINLGDTITISGASIPGNNGDWEVIEALRNEDGSAANVTVKQTIDRQLTDELIPEPSNVTCTYQKRIIAELNWPQAQLEDGTLIWEAYDNNNWDNEDIDGYWVVTKPNQTTGEYEFITNLKMSENFWEYWYDYTVKVEGEPNSVILTTWINGYGVSQNVGSYKLKLSLVNNQLVLTETIFDLEQTFTELYIELTDGNPELEYSLSFERPWYNSDNDYYGMMFGPQMGWTWTYNFFSPQYYVGYNMLTGETQLIDISESFYNIKNINYQIYEGDIESTIGRADLGFISHAKYGLLIQLISNYLISRSPTALWSPNFTNVEYATILDMYDNNRNLIFTDGFLSSSYRSAITNDYSIVAMPNTLDNPQQGITFSRKKLDDSSANSEYETLTEVFPSTIYTNELGVYLWERENSFTVSYQINFGGPLSNDNFFVWRDDKLLPELIKTPNMYPNMVEDDKLTGWDNSWVYMKITSMTNKFKNKTF